MKTHLIEKYPGHMDWDTVKQWVYDGGIPDDAQAPDSPAFDIIDQQRKAFLAGELPAEDIQTFIVRSTAQGMGMRKWNTQEWMYFLDGLPKKTPLDKIKALDEAFQLTGTPNAEIGMRWYKHAILAGDKAVWDAAAEHMTRIGRMYLTLPIYKAFASTPEGLAYAEKVFAKAKAGYHPMTQKAAHWILAKAKKTFAEADKKAANTDDDETTGDKGAADKTDKTGGA